MARGRAAETGATDYMAATYWPLAERRRQSGAKDRGDINPGTKRLCVEVKADATPSFSAHLREIADETRNAGAELGFVVYQPPGWGLKRVDQWWAVMSEPMFNKLCDELNQAGAPGQPRTFIQPAWKSLDIAHWLTRAELWGFTALRVPSRGKDNPDWVFTRFGLMCAWLNLAGYGGFGGGEGTAPAGPGGQSAGAASEHRTWVTAAVRRQNEAGQLDPV